MLLSFNLEELDFFFLLILLYLERVTVQGVMSSLLSLADFNPASVSSSWKHCALMTYLVVCPCEMRQHSHTGQILGDMYFYCVQEEKDTSFPCWKPQEKMRSKLDWIWHLTYFLTATSVTSGQRVRCSRVKVGRRFVQLLPSALVILW